MNNTFYARISGTGAFRSSKPEQHNFIRKVFQDELGSQSCQILNVLSTSAPDCEGFYVCFANYESLMSACANEEVCKRLRAKLQRRFYCSVCDAFLATLSNIEDHFFGRKHVAAANAAPAASKYIDWSNLYIHPIEDDQVLPILAQQTSASSSSSLPSSSSSSDFVSVSLPVPIATLTSSSSSSNFEGSIKPFLLPTSQTTQQRWRFNTVSIAIPEDHGTAEPSPATNSSLTPSLTWGLSEITFTSQTHTPILPLLPLIESTDHLTSLLDPVPEPLPIFLAPSLPASTQQTWGLSTLSIPPPPVPEPLPIFLAPSLPASTQQTWGLSTVSIPPPPPPPPPPIIESSVPPPTTTIALRPQEVVEVKADPQILSNLLLAPGITFPMLRSIARENMKNMLAIHDTIICTLCGRLGSETIDVRVRIDAKALFFIAAGSWIRRPADSFGKNAKSITIILANAAKLRLENEDRDGILIDLLKEAVRLSKDFDASAAVACFCVAADLRTVDLGILLSLAKVCGEQARYMNPQEAVSIYFIAATMGILDPQVINSLTTSCVSQCNMLCAQDAARCLWAASAFGLQDPVSATALAQSCTSHLSELAPDDTSQCLASAAKLNVTDLAVLFPLAKACAVHVSDLSPHYASDALWAVAKIGMSDTSIHLPLIRWCITKLNELNPSEISNCLWSAAAIAISDPRVVEPLVRACVTVCNYFNPQEAANTLVASALLGITDTVAINAFVQTCIHQIHDFLPQDTANNLWAAAKLNIVDGSIIHDLATACVVRSKSFGPRDAANALWAAAMLSISDGRIIGPLSIACIKCVDYFSAQEATNCLWSAAKVGVSDAEFINMCVRSCVKRIDEFSPQNAAIALWAAAVLGLTDFAITLPLVLAVNNHFTSITLLDDCEKCLQAHYAGFELKLEALDHFRAILKAGKPPHHTVSLQQQSIASTLDRLGYATRLDVKLCNGLIFADIVIDLPNKMRIAVVYDDASKFLRPPEARGALVGSIDGKTRIRNTLIPRSGYISSLIVIPFFEWEEVAGDKDREEGLLRKRLSDPLFHSQLR